MNSESYNPPLVVVLPPEGKNGLYYGDNWDILRAFPDGFVDLVYIDPPFNSQRDYNVIFDNSVAEEKAFADTWSLTTLGQEREVIEREPQRYSALIGYLDPMETILGKGSPTYSYLLMMGVRIVEIHRVLKPTGSLYVHCDPTASHYLKTLLDRVFGAANFRNDIVWKRRTGSSSQVHISNKFGACTDDLLFYVKSDAAVFHPQYNMDARGYMAYVDKTFRFVDENGRRYRIADLANPAPRPNLMYRVQELQAAKERLGNLS